MVGVNVQRGTFELAFEFFAESSKPKRLSALQTLESVVRQKT